MVLPPAPAAWSRAANRFLAAALLLGAFAAQSLQAAWFDRPGKAKNDEAMLAADKPRTATKDDFLSNLPNSVPKEGEFAGEDAVVFADVFALNADRVFRCITVYVRTAAGVADWADFSVDSDDVTFLGSRTQSRGGGVVYSQQEDQEDDGGARTVHVRAARPGCVIQIQVAWRLSHPRLAEGVRGVYNDPFDGQMPPFLFALGHSCRTERTQVYFTPEYDGWFRIEPASAAKEIPSMDPQSRCISVTAPVVSAVRGSVPVRRPYLTVGSTAPYYATVNTTAPVNTWRWFGLEMGRRCFDPWDGQYPDLGKKVDESFVLKMHKEGDKAVSLKELETVFDRKLKEDKSWSFLLMYWTLHKKGYPAHIALFREPSALEPREGPPGLGWFSEVGVAVRLANGEWGYILEDHEPFVPGVLPARYAGGWAWMVTDYAHDCPLVKLPESSGSGVRRVRCDWRKFNAANPAVEVELTLEGEPAMELMRRYGLPGKSKPGDRRRDAAARRIWRGEATGAWLRPVGDPRVETTGMTIRITGGAHFIAALPERDQKIWVRPLQFSVSGLTISNWPDAMQFDLDLESHETRVEEHWFNDNPGGVFKGSTSGPLSVDLEVKGPEPSGGPWRVLRTSRSKARTVPVEQYAAFLADVRTSRSWNDLSVSLPAGAAAAAPAAAEPEEAPEVEEGVYAFLRHELPGTAKAYKAIATRYANKCADDSEVFDKVTKDFPWTPPPGGVLTQRFVFPAPHTLEAFSRQWHMMVDYSGEVRSLRPVRAWVMHAPFKRFGVKTDGWTRHRMEAWQPDAGEDADDLWIPDLDHPWAVELDWDLPDALQVPLLQLPDAAPGFLNATVELPSASSGWRALLLEWKEGAGNAPDAVACRALGDGGTTGPVGRGGVTGTRLLRVMPSRMEWEGKSYDLTTWPGFGALERAFMAVPAATPGGTPGGLPALEKAYQRVQKTLRYVSIPLGIHGLVPHKLEEIRARGWGDCKDMTLDFLARAASTGVEVWPAYVHSEWRYAEKEPATPDFIWFDHVLAAVRGADGNWTFWDATSDALAPGELRGDLAGQSILVMTDPPQWVHTPAAHAEDSRVHTTLSFTPDGDLIRVRMQEDILGPLSRQVKDLFAGLSEAELRELFLGNAGWVLDGLQTFEGATVEKIPGGLRTVSTFTVLRLPGTGRLFGIPGAYQVSSSIYGSRLLPHHADVRLIGAPGLTITSLLKDVPLARCPEGGACQHLAFERTAAPRDDDAEGGDPGGGKDDEAISLRNPPDAWFLLESAP